MYRELRKIVSENFSQCTQESTKAMSKELYIIGNYLKPRYSEVKYYVAQLHFHHSSIVLHIGQFQGAKRVFAENSFCFETLTYFEA